VNTFKNFKTVKSDELISLLSESDISTSNATASVFGLIHDLPEKHYERLVSEKLAFSTVIQFDGKPAYRIIWQKIVQGTQIWVLMAQQLSRDANALWLGLGIDKIARLEKVSAVIFATARKALIEQCRTWGAVPVQILMKKDYVW
jgi:hypothetical protein